MRRTDKALVGCSGESTTFSNRTCSISVIEFPLSFLPFLFLKSCEKSIKSFRMNGNYLSQVSLQIKGYFRGRQMEDSHKQALERPQQMRTDRKTNHKDKQQNNDYNNEKKTWAFFRRKRKKAGCSNLMPFYPFCNVKKIG